MGDRVVAATQNNARWCDSVCRSHGLPTVLSEQLWIAPEGSPRLYPDAVTLARGLTVDDLLTELDAGPGCSVKDSFADLDLSDFGFTVLFDATWFYREPEPPPARSRSDWHPVTTDDELGRWAVAADLVGIIRPELLRDHTVRFLARRDGPTVTGGAILNRTDAVVGLSNVFTTASASTHTWRDLSTAAFGTFHDLPIVGYERDSRLAAAVNSGFQAIGPLRVWMKPASTSKHASPHAMGESIA
jgi:hypothetical protein